MKLELLIGMIASGKSTYCRKRAAEGAIIVNDDSIVTAIHGGDYTLYSDNLKVLYKSIEHAIISHAFALGRDVVIDRPCFKESTRRRYIELAKGYDAEVIGIHFPKHPPEVHAARRSKSDGRGHSYGYWLNVAQIHDGLYEPPTEAEGYNRLEFLRD